MMVATLADGARIAVKVFGQGIALDSLQGIALDSLQERLQMLLVAELGGLEPVRQGLDLNRLRETPPGGRSPGSGCEP